MADPIAVTIRFSGDPDELMERFERARQMWIDEQGADYERPIFYAVARAGDGIAVISAWETAVAHRAFGEGLHPHIVAAGLEHPEEIERLRIEKLDWE